MEYANSNDKELFLGLLDYEKAFDFCNRADLLRFLMVNNAGDKFVKAVARMYTRTQYIPKVNCNRLGDAIESKCGVAQGRKSSATLFSYELHDMPKTIDQRLTETFLLQLADDTAIAIVGDECKREDSWCSLSINFKNLFDYSKEKFLYVNYLKTHYIHLSQRPIVDPLRVDGYDDIMPADINEAIYLGMLFIQSSSVTDQINANLKFRAFHIKKFHDWLDINMDTPMKIKLKVLYSCVFPAMLYGCEAWFNIDGVAEKILKIERSFLRRILCVRDTTPNDLLYAELRIPDIISRIKKRQTKFFGKICSLTDNDSITRYILELCQHLPCYDYYTRINPNITRDNISSRIENIRSSEESTYFVRYTH